MSLTKKNLPRSGSQKLASNGPSRIDLLQSALNAPTERRGFLRAMAAGMGGLTLAACGGGGSGANGTATANAASSPGAASGAGAASSASSTVASARATQQYMPVSTGFYGLNGHLNSGNAYGAVSLSTQLQLMQDLGVTNTRQDLWDLNGAKSLVTLSDALSGSGIQITAAITPSLPPIGMVEDLAYHNAWQLGYAIASTLKGRVHVYECGNELENAFITGAGDKPSDYPAAPYFLYRGVMRGMIDGVRAADSNAAIAVTGGWLHYGVLQMLSDGTDPLGGSGGPTATWDITSWHWYNDMGDITSAGDNKTNVLEELTQRFQRPIWIGEYGYRPNGQTGSTLWNKQAAYLPNAMARFLQLKSQYNIQCIMLYELFDMPTDPGYGLITGDGVTKKPAYSAVKSFIANHPA